MKIKLFIPAVCALMLLGSCRSSDNTLKYFTDLPAEGAVDAGDYTLKIVPNDELVVNVSAADPSAVEEYTVPYQHPRLNDFNTASNVTAESVVQQRKNSNLTYQTYTVSKEGFINFPVLGKIHVEGMTLNGLADYLADKIGEKVIDPIVTVELVNFHVNVTGEVRNPGVQLVNRERYSVLDAIAAAGDLNVYGIRNNVLLIRENEGKREYHHIDLNSKEFLESPYYYLQQNDVIYVEPNRVREANARTDQERSFRLSVISTIVSAASVVASMAIAIFAK